MLPAFFGRLTSLFSPRVLVSGTLPALLLMGYGALFLTLLTKLPVAQIWSSDATLTTVLALLCLIALTYLFESLKTVFTQWMCGKAIWIPNSVTEHWSKKQQRERDQLNNKLRNITDQIERSWMLKSAWKAQSARLIAGAQDAAIASPGLDRVKASAREYSVDLSNSLEYFQTLASHLSDIMMSGTEPGCTARVSKGAVQAAKHELDILLLRIDRSLDVALDAADRERLAKFPQSETVTPTRFGNRMAAIDSYTSARYGMDANLIWHRLRQANKQAEAWQAVDDAKAALDFIVSSLWVHVLVACVTLAAWPLLWHQSVWAFASLIVASVFFVFTFHVAALEAVTSFGRELSASIDLNRWTLLSALHLPMPLNAEEEFEIWSRFGIWIRYDQNQQTRANIEYR
jgi:hypothetical protein